MASYNPGYRRGSKDLKPSTRQRFVAVALEYPPPAIEAEIVATEAGCEAGVAKRLVALGHKIRGLSELALPETVSTRLLVHTARLIRGGLEARLACEVGLVQALSDDDDITRPLSDLAALVF
ncbi:MAG: CbbQ/NirQ/NorQ C-terminal domain-containing protein [Myxococcales bacterium]|nr:CbbQ/NirQ/NorQ C-terminal domain-containing protein [Myxococcales bacterium]